MAEDPPEAETDDPGFWGQAWVISRRARTSVHLRLAAEVHGVFRAEPRGKGHIRKRQDLRAAFTRAQRR